MALNETILNELSILMGEKIGTGRESLSNINVSTYEMQETYKEKEPYAIAKTLIGDRYIWTEAFINKVLYSLSTDDLADMNPSEYKIMMGFIAFQDKHSTINNIEQANKGAIGCTNKDENGISRPFAMIQMGGDTNGSSLHGHNYTYVGSTWGSIVQILIDKKCMNPIIFIDEIDKISKTEHGKEIVGILTHLLDPSQNDSFQDKCVCKDCLDIISKNRDKK